MTINDRLNVVLYTRGGCHLCEEAHQLLNDVGLSPKVVDIDADELLKYRFDTCVPVVEIDGRVRFRGRIELRLLQRIIRSAVK
jgi:glutaredoxin